MTLIYSSSLNLSLPIAPDDTVKPEIALAIAPVHYALHSLHQGISQLTGAWVPSAAEWPTITPSMTLYAGLRRKIYLVAAANFTAGQLFYINNIGQAQLASAAAAVSLAQGWVTQPVNAGSTGEFILFEGLLAVAGAVAGTKYYCANAPGTIGIVAGAVPQLIGVGVAANLIYMRMAIQ